MTLDVEYNSRSGSTAAGKDWDAFIERQSSILAKRANDGWELVTALDVVEPSAMREASRTAGVLLYFRRS